jgi:uncharacterized phage protein gp47/JayE
MANYAAVIDYFGISAPTYPEILAGIQQEYKTIYGQDVYLEPDSQDGQHLAIFAFAINDANNAVIAAYQSFSPATAQGAGLSTVVKINGIKRKIPSYSQAVVRIVGVAGTVINGGIVADTDGGNQWRLPGTVTISPSGEVFVTVTARNPGDLRAQPNTIVTIITSVPGWQTVSNAAPATPGSPIESDAALRRRQTRSTALPAKTLRESIYATIATIVGVSRLAVFENDGHSVDDDAIPPHTIAVVVEGGNLQDIASAIALKKTPGTGTYGSSTTLVFDSQGVPNTINLSFLNTVDIYYKVTIKALNGYTTTTGAKILAAIAEYLNTLEIGEDLYYSRLWGPANLTGSAAVGATGLTQSELDALNTTYVIQNIQIGLSLTTLSTANIPMVFDQSALGDVSLGEIVVGS